MRQSGIIRNTDLASEFPLIASPASGVHVRVKLTNAAVESLARRGEISWDGVSTCEVSARVDATMIHSAIPPSVQSLLGLEVRGQRLVERANGRMESVGIVGPIIFEVMRRETIEEALVHGDEVLIGQSVLAKNDLGVDSASGRPVSNFDRHAKPVTKMRRELV